MNFKTILESDMCVFYEKVRTKKRRFNFPKSQKPLFSLDNSSKECCGRKVSPARVKLLETSDYGAFLEVRWTCKSKERLLVQLDERAVLHRMQKPNFCMRLTVANGIYNFYLAAQTETDCQRWTRALLDAFVLCPQSEISAGVRGSKRFSLCLSNYFVCTTGGDAAKNVGFGEFEYWAVVDKEAGKLNFFSSRFLETCGSSAISFDFDEVCDAKMVSNGLAEDDGKLFEIVLVRRISDQNVATDLQPVEKKRKFCFGFSAMTKRWHKPKSAKKSSQGGDAQLAPVAVLGYNTLSLFCPDAQKLVDELKTAKNATESKTQKRGSADMNGNRISANSDRHNTNLSSISLFLRRSLPSLTNPHLSTVTLNSTTNTNSPSTPMTPASISQAFSMSPKTPSPPPLPSRRELEERENGRLLEKNQSRENNIYNQLTRTGSDHFRNRKPLIPKHMTVDNTHYKILTGDPVPVHLHKDQNVPPPLPPKNPKLDTCANQKLEKRAALEHYKVLPPCSPTNVYEPPPLPPRRLSSSDNANSSLESAYSNCNLNPLEKTTKNRNLTHSTGSVFATANCKVENGYKLLPSYKEKVDVYDCDAAPKFAPPPPPTMVEKPAVAYSRLPEVPVSILAPRRLAVCGHATMSSRRSFETAV